MDKRIIVFHGKSDLTVKRKIAQIIEKQIPESERSLAVNQFRSYESGDQEKKRAEVIESFLSLPLGCSCQLVVVWQYQHFFSPVQLRKAIPQIPDNTWVVLVSDSSLSDGEKKKLSALPGVEVVIEYFVKWDGVRHHLQRFFQEHEFKVGREVMDHLVKLFSDSPSAMDQELEKVAVYFDPGRQVTWTSLKDILSIDQSEAVAYGVMNVFFEKRLSLTLKKFREYLSNQGDIGLLVTVMIRELVLILKFKEMKADGKPVSEIFRKLGVIYDKHKKSLQAKEVLFQYPDIVQILQECFRVDKGLRSESFVNLDVSRPRTPLKAKLQLERLFVMAMA